MAEFELAEGVARIKLFTESLVRIVVRRVLGRKDLLEDDLALQFELILSK